MYELLVFDENTWNYTTVQIICIRQKYHITLQKLRSERTTQKM